jgi:hypothetical protein
LDGAWSGGCADGTSASWGSAGGVEGFTGFGGGMADLWICEGESLVLGAALSCESQSACWRRHVDESRSCRELCWDDRSKLRRLMHAIYTCLLECGASCRCSDAAWVEMSGLSRYSIN